MLNINLSRIKNQKNVRTYLPSKRLCNQLNPIISVRDTNTTQSVEFVITYQTPTTHKLTVLIVKRPVKKEYIFIIDCETYIILVIHN